MFGKGKEQDPAGEVGDAGSVALGGELVAAAESDAVAAACAAQPSWSLHLGLVQLLAPPALTLPRWTETAGGIRVSRGRCSRNA